MCDVEKTLSHAYCGISRCVRDRHILLNQKRGLCQISCKHIYVVFWHILEFASAIRWWRHQMETFSGLLALCAENSPVTGEWTILIKLIACHLFSKPLPEVIVLLLNLKWITAWEFQTKYSYFVSGKCIWKWRVYRNIECKCHHHIYSHIYSDNDKSLDRQISCSRR